MHKAQRLINHVALVLDGSSSMSGHKAKLIEVADQQIKHLALRSEEMSQETRVSVYLFNTRVECLIFDMDVMRLPSIADLYKTSGMTALVDALIKSQQDLGTTSQIYGDHAFLTFVLTDGYENASKNSWTKASQYLGTGDNWTVGWLVPDTTSKAYVERIGATKGSIAMWDKDTAKGLVDAVSTIRTATDNFMNNRAKGVRGSAGVFSTGVDVVNKQTVKQSLTPLKNFTHLFVGGEPIRIDEFVRDYTGSYSTGSAFYQLTKSENIQPQKEVLVVDKATGVVYGGSEARNLIGLGSITVRVRPDANPLYDIYVQSTSLNRKLVPNTKVLVRK